MDPFIDESKNKKIDEKLRSPGMGANSRMFVKVPAMVLRGALAPPAFPLAGIHNVGGFRAWDKDGKRTVAAIPFVDMALEVLEEDPLEPGVEAELRTVAESPDSGAYAAHLKYLKKIGVLAMYGVHDPKTGAVTTKDGVEMPRPVIARYTAVYKDKKGARAIFNCRYLNPKCTKKSVPFSLLGSRALVEALRRLEWRRLDLRIVHCDVLNCYYQYSSGLKGRRCMCVKVGNLIYMCLVMMMGWWKSCGIAQGLVWGTILMRMEGEPSLGIPEEVYNMKEAPGFIELEGGGLIVLVYDSVLLIAPRELAHQWRARLERNFDLANVKLKYLIEEPLGSTMAYTGIQLRTSEDGSFWSLEPTTVETWNMIVRQPLVNSPLTLFRLLGMLRFAAPILGWQEYRLGRLTKEQSRLGMVEKWNDPCVNEEIIRAACRMIQALVGGEESHPKSHYVKRKGDVLFVAVDATPFRWAMWPMKDGKVIKSECKEKDFVKEESIDVAEAYVVAKAIAYGQLKGAGILVVGNDNQPVGYGYLKGYARADAMDGEISDARYTEGRMALVMADIPSEENVSDIGTRPKVKYSPEDVKFRTERSWSRMQAALENWKKTARSYLKRVEGAALTSPFPGSVAPVAAVMDDQDSE